MKLVKPFALFAALLRGHLADGAGLRKAPLPDAEELSSSPEAGGADPPLPEGHRHLSLENEGKGCWAHCGNKAGDCGYCGTGQCCRAVDYRNQVPGCEKAENAVGARCGDYRGGGFPSLMNVGLPCIGRCGKQPGDCDYCGTAGQCCRPFDGERCVPGCELASTDSSMMPGSKCGEFKDPSAAHCTGAPPTTPPPTNPPTNPPTDPPTAPPTTPPTTPPTILLVLETFDFEDDTVPLNITGGAAQPWDYDSMAACSGSMTLTAGDYLSGAVDTESVLSITAPPGTTSLTYFYSFSYSLSPADDFHVLVNDVLVNSYEDVGRGMWCESASITLSGGDVVKFRCASDRLGAICVIDNLQFFGSLGV